MLVSMQPNTIISESLEWGKFRGFSPTGLSVCSLLNIVNDGIGVAPCGGFRSSVLGFLALVNGHSNPEYLVILIYHKDLTLVI